MTRNKNLWFSFCLASVPLFLALILPTKHYTTVEGNLLVSDWHRLTLTHNAAETASYCDDINISIRAFPSSFLYQNSHVLVMTSKSILSDKCIEKVIASLDFANIVTHDEKNKIGSTNLLSTDERIASNNKDKENYEGHKMRVLTRHNDTVNTNETLHIARHKTPNVLFYSGLSIVLLMVFIGDAATRTSNIHRL